MKISYISGVKGRANSMQSESNLIGSLDWADRAGVKLSFAQKAEIRVKQFQPLISTARGIVRELISGNRGGLADMLYGMSPFNTEGKIDPSLKAQWDGAKSEIVALANRQFPLTKKTFSSAVQAAVEFNKWKAKNLTKKNEDFFLVEDANFAKNKAFISAEIKKINKKFPYMIYPPATEAAKAKYRELEIMWLNYGGNVDSFNAAVKEGVTKSPRNKTFNYLLGKFAAKTYKTKDLGLAIRAVVGAALGGDRFSWTDTDIFNPWVKKFGSGNISGAIGADPATGAGAAAATTASAPWWVPILTKLCYAIIAMLPALFGLWSSRDDNPPAQVGGGGGNGGGGNDTSNLTQYALPIGAAVAAYLLLFSDDKKD
jgi:hypothetical protein